MKYPGFPTVFGASLPVLLILVILLSIPVPSLAWFENLQPSPRARALGGAVTAASEDAASVYFNPACLALSTLSYEAAASYHNVWGQDYLKFYEARALVNLEVLGKFGRIGCGFQQQKTVYQGNDLASETTVSLAQGFTFMEDIHSSLSAGYTLNLYLADFHETALGEDLGSGWTGGLDAGFVATVRRRTRVGAFIKNLNKPVLGVESGHSLPQRLSIGLSYLPYAGIMTGFDIEKPLGEPIVLRGGVEYGLTDFLLLRAGMESDPVTFNAGLAVCLSGITVEYAYADHPVLPGSHLFGVGLVR